MTVSFEMPPNGTRNLNIIQLWVQHYLYLMLLIPSFSTTCISVDIQHFYKLLPSSMMIYSVTLLRQPVWTRQVKCIFDPSQPFIICKQKVDFRTVTLAHDARLSQYHQEWSKRFNDDTNPDGISWFFVRRHLNIHIVVDPSCAFRCTLLPL